LNVLIVLIKGEPLFCEKRRLFFGGYIPHRSQIGNHLSDRKKARGHTPPGNMTSQAKVREVFDSPNLGSQTTRTSMSQAKTMEVLICPNLGRLTTRTSMSQAKVMEVLICPNLDRLTTRSSTS